MWEDADSLPDAQLVPPQVKPQQQSSGSSGTQPGSTVPGPSPIGAGQSPIGHPPVSLQGPLSPPPFNSTGQPSHINYQVCCVFIFIISRINPRDRILRGTIFLLSGIPAVSWFTGGAIRWHVGHTVATGGVIQHRLGTIASTSGRFIWSVSIRSKSITIYAVRAVRSVPPEFIQSTKRVLAATATATTSRAERSHARDVPKQFVPIPHCT